MAFVLRIPFTIILLVSVLTVSMFAQGFMGTLDSGSLANFGHAPKHLAIGEIERLLCCVVITHDIRHLAAACTMIGLIVGVLEWRARTYVALWIFFASHLFSSILFASGIGILHVVEFSPIFTSLYNLHDVGPSAGYNGCLAALIRSIPSLPKPKRLTAVFIGVLMLRIAFSLCRLPDATLALSADIVHLIAFLLGALLWLPKPSIASTKKE